MMPAAKMMDPILGIDIHMIQPPGPVPPLPIPHPFIVMLFDPMDLVPILGATILVNGMPRGIAGTAAKAARLVRQCGRRPGTNEVSEAPYGC